MFSSGAQSCLTLCDPMDCSTPGLRVHHQLPEFTQTHVHWVSDTIQGGDTMQEEKGTTEDVVVLLLQSIFPSIRVFSNESVFRIRWPKYWSFSIIISPSNEYSGLSYVNKGQYKFFYKSQSKSSEGYFIGHIQTFGYNTHADFFFFFANMMPPKPICSYFRFGVWRMLDPWPHWRVNHKDLKGGFSDLWKITIHKVNNFFFIFFLLEKQISSSFAQFTHAPRGWGFCLHLCILHSTKSLLTKRLTTWTETLW